jgi:hypothetical protein
VGGTEYIIGFEGSQALPVCPSGKCKLLTGTIKVKFYLALLSFYLDDVRTSQKTQVSRVCYRDSFTFTFKPLTFSFDIEDGVNMY